MFNKPTDTLTLANGVKIPCLGYGTWQTPAGGVACEGVKTALKCGYRHIDTANAYGNEEDVGKGIKESGVPREEIFLTTKHWITERGYTNSFNNLCRFNISWAAVYTRKARKALEQRRRIQKRLNVAAFDHRYKLMRMVFHLVVAWACAGTFAAFHAFARVYARNAHDVISCYL